MNKDDKDKINNLIAKLMLVYFPVRREIKELDNEVDWLSEQLLNDWNDISLEEVATRLKAVTNKLEKLEKALS